MRTFTLALTLTALALLAPPARAQQPYPYRTPYGSYNQQRAYSHFLRSPAAVKTYSTAQPGRAWGYDTPFESARYTRSPAYYREYVSPYRHEAIDIPSVETETVLRRPVVVYPDYPPPVAYPDRYDYRPPVYRPSPYAERRLYTPPRYFR